MQCPYCEKEMEKGYIQSRDGLGWSAKKRVVLALAGTLAQTRLGCDVVAYRCKNCQKILIDYSQEEE